MGHTLDQYLDRTRNRLGDLGVLQHLADPPFELALEEALITYSKDHPRTATFTAAGDSATYAFDLTADADNPWLPDWSRIIDIEYPTGTARRRTFIEPRDADERDGTITLYDVTPATGYTLTIRYTTTWPYPTDVATDDLVADVHFPAITALAAAQLARGKALEYARKQSSSVLNTTIDLDPAPLFSAAKELEKVYTNLVLGRTTDAGTPAGGLGFAVSDVDVFQSTIFHQRAAARD